MRGPYDDSMNQEDYHPLLASSVDPRKLAISIKGALGVFASLVAVLGYADFFAPLINNLDIDTIVTLITGASTAVSFGVFLFGLVRKIHIAYSG